MIPLVISWSLIVLGWSLVFLVFYFTMGTTIKDRLIRLLYWVMVKIFFREITISHLERIPVDKPVMLVCAPHANQFVDAMVLSTHLQRKLFFIGAASSFTKYKVAGMFMRWMDSIIPVERQQDIKQVISGRASVQGNRVIGENTHFTKETQKNGFLLVNGGRYRIAQIMSDKELEVTKIAHEKYTKQDGTLTVFFTKRV